MKSNLRMLTALALGALLGAVGCGKAPTAVPGAAAQESNPPKAAQTAQDAPVSPTQSQPAARTAAQLAQFHPNEAGGVPILEYHDISPTETRWGRSAAGFRRDLERLYKEGYRPVALQEYLANRIALPPGKSPVILTFDDARESQFRYRPDGRLDPNCAVGILEAFQKAHPDFRARATFYVLPDSAFGQPKFAARKMQELLAMGFEIGNHTVSHTPLKQLSDERVQAELAGCVAKVQKMAPQAKVESVALPDGIAPRNRALLASGAYQGQRYINRAALLVGSNPAPSPVSPRFDPMRLPRIQAIEGPMGITYWLDDLKRHPERRYVSDGDPNTVTVPRAQADNVDKAKLHGATLRVY
ncbi:MAG TPA: polysaccharide deacetylase family protein [Chthonomonadaceae bacterium]|nr:polysaccharide deacetylase family protein [Chthonomonadaceae bacterium]